MTQYQAFPTERLLASVGDPVVVASFMRSGTHLTIDALRKNYHCFSSYKYPLEKNSYLYADLDVYMNPLRLFQVPGLRARLLRSRRPIFKCHWSLSHWDRVIQCHPALAHWIQSRGRIVFVVRDPRAILLSNLAWNASVDPCLSPQSLPDVAVSLLTRLEQRWQDVLSCGIAPIHVLDASSLLKDPNSVISDLARFLDIPEPVTPSLPFPLRSLWASRWQRLTGIRPESTAILTSHRSSEFSWVLQNSAVECAMSRLLAKTDQYPFLAAFQ